MTETTVQARALRSFRDHCMAVRGGDARTGTPGVNWIPDQVIGGMLTIEAFGGPDAPWARELTDSWNLALTWRSGEASGVAAELLLYAQALEVAAKAYEDTDATSAAGMEPYEHF